MTSARVRMVVWAINQANSPYVWGGRGHDVWSPSGLKPTMWAPVYDCSGLVLCAYRYAAGYDLRATYNAQAIWEKGKKVALPGTASVACYGANDRCHHVMLHCFDGVVIGASGGDVDCVTPDAARERELRTGIPAKVVSFSNYLYRQDFLGWRDFDFGDEP